MFICFLLVGMAICFQYAVYFVDMHILKGPEGKSVIIDNQNTMLWPKYCRYGVKHYMI